MLIYKSAWLKRHYPVEFMAATLNSCMGVSERVAHYIHKCRQNGISVLAPDINRSLSKFSVVDGNLRFGLAAVKNIGHNAVEAIIDEREENGAFRSFTDFLRRVGTSFLNKRGVESLIRSGAFDSLNLTRSSLLTNFERLLEGVVNSLRSQLEGQISFLGEAAAAPGGPARITLADGAGGLGGDIVYGDNLPFTPEYPQNILLGMEKEILGLYVSGHPLEEYMPRIAGIVNCDSRDFRRSREGAADADADDAAGTAANDGTGIGGDEAGQVMDGRYVVMGGIIAGVKTKFTKNNALMAIVNLEDIYGGVEMLVFPQKYEKIAPAIKDGRLVLVKGKVSTREDEDAKLLCDDLAEIETVLSGRGAGLRGGEARPARTSPPREASAQGQPAPIYDVPAYDGATEFGGADGGGQADAATLYIRVNGDEPGPLYDSAYATLKYFSGRTPVVLYNCVNKTRKNLGGEFRVKMSGTLLEEMREKFGAENVALR